MTRSSKQIFIGNSTLQTSSSCTTGDYCTRNGESFYRISHYDQMDPFFMSIVSVADHWLFLSSTGGLSAGRVNAESALFPYYTDDKLTENSDNTGHLAIFLVEKADRRYRWEPFSDTAADLYQIERNLYKNVIGSKVIFEEINHDLNLTYRYAWRSSNRFGFVKTSWLQNNAEQAQTITLLDGLQNLLPFGATVALQTSLSNLLNGYKRSELDEATGLGIFALNATLTDLAEPSESLKASSVWQRGLDAPQVLLSSQQVGAFRRGAAIKGDCEVRGYRGAYLVSTTLDLAKGEEKSWHFVAEVNQSHVELAALRNVLADNSAEIIRSLEADIEAGNQALRAIVASADGLQLSAETLTANHHFANVLFNTMRGGIFANNYAVSRDDICDFMQLRNAHVFAANQDALMQLPETFAYAELLALAERSDSADFQRLAYEYLPLTFSRRHGDPSRPWNQFSINISKPDGSQRLDYQGNWRDIFQNWEPLAQSYPEYIESIIAKFLNATTADGYNPYRVTREGIEWESPDPDDPWANIGYWSDHQIIYLERLLDISRRFHPGRLEAMLGQRIFSHANVPYRIKPYDDILQDPYNTIQFDWDADAQIANLVAEMGTDGKLVHTADGAVLHVNLAEKLLLLLLAKLSNFVPEGGIWMITQRPEWNDANNALVGKGLSVVTLCHLRNYIRFFTELLASAGLESVEVSSEVAGLFGDLVDVLRQHREKLNGQFSDTDRRTMMDQLGRASNAYRGALYSNGFSGDLTDVDAGALRRFLEMASAYVDHSIRANKRTDNLFHSYNVLALSDGEATVSYLSEMLEGQVAVLSTGLLNDEASLAVLKALRSSKLYRADQHSYMLYPDRVLPGFLDKNCVSAENLQQSPLIKTLLADNNHDIMVLDENGVYHFNAAFRNANNLRDALDSLRSNSRYTDLVEAESDSLLNLFEKVFNHSAFTGRSGTFFAFEGLGSIYWHQVSKLLLSAQESAMRAIESGGDPETAAALVATYYDIRDGIGFNKSPAVYGAFPTDPYSHTPANQGAKQPGMTGQVKEEILTRMVELGISVADGCISFNPRMLCRREFSAEATIFDYVNVQGKDAQCDVPSNAIAFTFCQVPIVYQMGDSAEIAITYSDGLTRQTAGGMLDAHTSRHIFQRDGAVQQLQLTINQDQLI